MCGPRSRPCWPASRSSLRTCPRASHLYRLFHVIWSSSASQFDQEIARDVKQLTPEERLRSLSSADRAALLLTAVEGFSLNEAGKILGESPEEVEQAIVQAQHAIERQLASRVLIIEDESIIALDLENLVAELGHKVVGAAATKDEAVAKARANKPGLVLADINLGEGGSGIDAVTEILRTFDIPVIFITAYPERLLTGERPEPTYLITKPFLPGNGSGDDRAGPCSSTRSGAKRHRAELPALSGVPSPQMRP